MDDELNNIEEWEFPDQYLENLKDRDIGTPEYNIIQGRLYEELRVDDRYTPEEALLVSTRLNNGEISQAFDLIYDQLEDGKQ